MLTLYWFRRNALFATQAIIKYSRRHIASSLTARVSRRSLRRRMLQTTLRTITGCYYADWAGLKNRRLVGRRGLYTQPHHEHCDRAVLTAVPGTLTHGKSYAISGRRFNGFSQANAYGDDAQAATNYPLVLITNATTGHLFYARTHNHSSMSVGSSATVATMFDVPPNIERGASRLVVVANGIRSAAVKVTVN